MLAKVICLSFGRRQKRMSTLPPYQIASPSCRTMLCSFSYMQGQFVQEFCVIQHLEKTGKEGEEEEKEGWSGESSKRKSFIIGA